MASFFTEIKLDFVQNIKNLKRSSNAKYYDVYFKSWEQNTHALVWEEIKLIGEGAAELVGHKFNLQNNVRSYDIIHCINQSKVDDYYKALHEQIYEHYKTSKEEILVKSYLQFIFPIASTCCVAKCQCENLFRWGHSKKCPYFKG